jgi:hypothetical protein
VHRSIVIELPHLGIIADNPDHNFNPSNFTVSGAFLFRTRRDKLAWWRIGKIKKARSAHVEMY